MPPLLRRIFSRKTFVRLAFAVAALITLLVATIAEENWRGERAWAGYRAAAAQRGARLYHAEFVAPPVPDAENFAAVPVIQEIYAGLEAGKGVTNPLDWPPGFQYPKAGSSEQPKAGVASLADLAKWRDAFAGAKMIPQPTDNVARDVLTGVNHYDAILQQLHEAGLRPQARFPVKWEKSFATAIPHFGFFQAAASLFTLRMHAHLALGESGNAYADWRDGLALYRALEHEPTLISGLVRIAILNVLVGGVREGLAGRHWAEPELRALGTDIAGLNLVADLHFAIECERGAVNSGVDWLRAMRAHERWRISAALTAGSSMDGFPSNVLASWLYPIGWDRLSQLKMNALYDRRLSQIDAVQGRIVPDPSNDEAVMGLKQIGGLDRWRYALAALLMPALDTAEAKYAQTHSTMQEARIACALELYRGAHGAFPEKLEELVPVFLEAIPRDVMDGSPLHYRRTAEGGFALWSVGWNCQDDGGKSEPGGIPRSSLDWVWRS